MPKLPDILAKKKRSSRLDFQATQFEFAKNIRDPEGQSPPADIELRRLGIYQRLFYNNVESFCSKTCKSFRKFIPDDRWHELVRGFLRDHECSSPYFKEIPLEFMTYLSTVKDILLPDYPFALELCHYDWIQLELDLAPDPTPPKTFILQNLVQSLVLSPNARLLSYRWPVHNLNTEEIRTKRSSSDSGPYWFIFVRNLNNRVERISSNAHTIRAAELLKEPCTGLQLLDILASEWNTPTQLLGTQLFALLKKLVAKQVVFVMD